MRLTDRILLNSGPSERGWHRLEMYLKCPSLYAYRYLLKLDLGSRDPLIRGSIGHVGLAHHFARLRETQRGGDPDKYHTVADAMIEVSKLFGEDGLRLLPTAHRMVAACIPGLPEVEVVQVEEPIAAYVGWPTELAEQREDRIDATTGEPRAYYYTMRPDLIVKDAKGVWIWDHKFVGRASSATFEKYTCSGQFLAAQWFGHALYGDGFAGVKVHLVSEAEARIRTIEPAPHLLGSLPTIVCDAEEKIQDLLDEGRDPWQWPKVAHETMCTNSYGKCAYREICRWGKAGL